jgi:long-chain acyl-CoA synthetase
LSVINNLGQLFFQQVERYGDRSFLHWRQDEDWRSMSFQEAAEQVQRLATGLRDRSLKDGDRVAILAENRPEWFLADLACLSAGLVDVPLYATSPAPEIEHILRDSGAKALLISGLHQWQKVEPLLDGLDDLQEIFCMDPIEGSPAARLQPWGELACRKQDLVPYLDRVGRNDLATILYTSGTTGTPKGVLLSHGNLLSNCEAVLQHIEIRDADKTLSFLPLSHSFERTAGHYATLMAGAEIAYASHIDRVAVELKEVRPTILLGVPRFYEKIQARIVEALERGPAYRRRMFRWAKRVGERVFERQASTSSLPMSLRWRHEAADRLVFSRLRDRVGGRIRMLVSGGAPLDADIVAFFNHLGLPLLEGYGLSETSPIVSVNQPGGICPGAVGKVIPGVEVHIAEDGEILVRGPNVMQGYYNLPAETAEVLEADGTFHTGDIGELDALGNLRVTDRKKDLIISAGGKNISPQKVEYLLKRRRSIADVCLVGDRRPYLVALLVPDLTALKSLVHEHGLEWRQSARMLLDTDVVALFRHAVAEVNLLLSKPEQVKRFVLLQEPFSQENRELTPTLKVRRRIVENRYQEVIERLYETEVSHCPDYPVLTPQ